MNLDLHGKRALVVDDYGSMRAVIKKLLVGAGCYVAESENGLEGLEQLKKESFDIVFSDIVMPVMDGFELCQEIRSRKEFHGIPIVVMSTHSDASYLIKAINMGADDYITKPVEPKLLEKVIARLLEGLENG